MNKHRIWLAAGIAGAAGLYVLGTQFPEASSQLSALAGVVIGWLTLKRPGDTKATQ